MTDRVNLHRKMEVRSSYREWSRHWRSEFLRQSSEVWLADCCPIQGRRFSIILRALSSQICQHRSIALWFPATLFFLHTPNQPLLAEFLQEKPSVTRGSEESMIWISSPKLRNVSATEEDNRTSQETEEYEEDSKRKPLKTTGMRTQGAHGHAKRLLEGTTEYKFCGLAIASEARKLGKNKGEKQRE